MRHDGLLLLLACLLGLVAASQTAFVGQWALEGSAWRIDVDQSAPGAVECFLQDSDTGNVTVPVCGFQSCPCQTIQEGLDSAAVLLDASAAANGTDLLNIRTCNGTIGCDTTEVPIPSSLRASVFVSAGVYEGHRNANLHTERHAIALIGSGGDDTVLAATADVSAVALCITESTFAVANITFTEAANSTSSSLLRIVQATDSAVEMHGINFADFASTHSTVMYSLASSNATLRDIGLSNCSAATFVTALQDSNVDCVGVSVGNGGINNLGIIAVAQLCIFSDVELVGLAMPQAFTSFLDITASHGAVVLDNWHVYANSTLLCDQLVSVSSDADALVAASRWNITTVTAAETTLLSCEGCHLMVSDWEVSDVHIESALLATASAVQIVSSQFHRLSATNVVHGTDGSEFILNDIIASFVYANAFFGGAVLGETGVAINGSSFSNCSSNAVILVDQGSLNVESTNFTSNYRDFQVGSSRGASTTLTNVRVVKEVRAPPGNSHFGTSLFVADSSFLSVTNSGFSIESDLGQRNRVQLDNCGFDGFSIDSQVTLFTASNCTFVTNSESEASSQESSPFVSLHGFLEAGLLDNCHFIGARTTTVNSGIAIVATLPATVVVFNSTFDSLEGTSGAAIASRAADLRVEGSCFSGCISGAGAVYVQGGSMVMQNSSFSHNNATHIGGADIVATDTVLTLVDLSFSFSHSETNAGSLYFFGNVSGIGHDLRHIGCTATSGGAMVLSGTTRMAFVRSSFSSCASDASGGAVVLEQNTRVAFVEGRWEANSAISYGGGLYLQDSSVASLSVCTFKDNSCRTNGGGVYSQDHSSFSAEHSIFASNHVGGAGGAIALTVRSSGTIVNATFIWNGASAQGGALLSTDYATPTIEGSRFVLNYAATGGALLLSQHSQCVASSCVFHENNAAVSGGALSALDESRMVIHNSSFTLNTIQPLENSRGGAANIEDYAVARFETTDFKANAAWWGGALSLSTQAETDILECSFEENLGIEKGGAIYSDGYMDLRIYGSIFLENVAFKLSGGAMYSTTPFVNLGEGNVFEANWAKYQGGAVYLDGGAFVSGCEFIENGAREGGGLFTVGPGEAELKDCNFQGNYATDGKGGGLIIQKLVSKLTHCIFTGNTADSGGGLMLALPSDGQFILQQCLFDSNEALTEGGGMAVEVLIASKSVSGPPTETAYMPSREIEQRVMSVCVFLNNTASYGGALFVPEMDGLNMECSSCSFIGNVALQFGAAVFLEDTSGQTLLSNATFEDNYARWGGSTIAFAAVVDVQEISQNTCVQCNYSLAANFTGYQTDQGYATAPAVVAYANATACPANRALNAGPFSLEFGLKDYFNTHVTGPILSDEAFLIEFSWTGEGCWVVSPLPGSQRLEEATGGTTFTNITLQGKTNSTCSLVFTGELLSNTSQGAEAPDAVVTCQVALNQCEGDMVLEEGATYDTCVAPPTTEDTQTKGNTILALTVIFVTVILMLLVCCLVTLILFGVYTRRRRAEDEFYEDLEISDDIMKPTSLEALLNDPDITRIPWHQLEVLQRIGRGASGIVSSALWHVKDNEVRDVALKELTLELQHMDDKAAQDFLVEIRLMHALRHKNVVRFEGIAFHEDRLYLVTELMHQGSVKDVMLRKGRNLTWQIRTKLLLDAANGIQYLHSKKLIHRDLKPQNLLVNSKWVCKVADFGVSTIKTTTRTMTAIGTPVYMAPEVLNNERYSETADVYSFGIVVAEVYTGRQPYSESGLNDAQLLYKIYHDALRPSTAGLPDLARRLVEEALTRDAGLRPTFAEIVLRLKRLAKLDTPITELIGGDGQQGEGSDIELSDSALLSDHSEFEVQDSVLLDTGRSVNAYV